MLIISKFKDYYDFLVGIYGVDKNIVFKRGILKETEFKSKSRIYVPRMCENKNGDFITFSFLSICGKIYLILEDEKNGYHLLNKEDLKKEEIFQRLDHHYFSYFKRKRNKKTYEKILGNNIGVFIKSLIDIHKQTETPIFRIASTSFDEMRLNEESPNLSKIKGIAKLIPADELFKELHYFIGNILRNNPDPGCMSNISNRDKIIKGGFDPVTSFRKMKGE